MQTSMLIKQKSYEKVIHVLRRHWLTFIPFLFLYASLLVVPIIVGGFIRTSFPDMFDTPFIYGASVLFGSVYYLCIIAFFFTQFVDFYLDMTIITNDRIVDIEQSGLFKRVISELDLFQIQDVTTEVHGIGGTLFGYGNIFVKTASNNNIVFQDIPHPNNIREQLIRLADEDRKYHLNNTHT